MKFVNIPVFYPEYFVHGAPPVGPEKVEIILIQVFIEYFDIVFVRAFPYIAPWERYKSRACDDIERDPQEPIDIFINGMERLEWGPDHEQYADTEIVF